jgi:hypothetical protein
MAAAGRRAIRLVAVLRAGRLFVGFRDCRCAGRRRAEFCALVAVPWVAKHWIAGCWSGFRQRIRGGIAAIVIRTWIMKNYIPREGFLVTECVLASNVPDL